MSKKNKNNLINSVVTGNNIVKKSKYYIGQNIRILDLYFGIIRDCSLCFFQLLFSDLGVLMGNFKISLKDFRQIEDTCLGIDFLVDPAFGVLQYFFLLFSVFLKVK